MKSKWVIRRLNSRLPFWANSLQSPFRTQILSDPSSKTSTFVLNHVDVSLLLSICGREGYIHLGSSLHASFIKNRELSDSGCRNALVIWNSLLSSYSKYGVLADAVKLFDKMTVKDTVSWNTMISGFLRNGDLGMGFSYFKQMQELGVYGLDHATFTTMFSACDRPELCGVTMMIHCLVVLRGLEKEITVGNSLITSYLKCGSPSPGRQVFDEMLERNVITWTAIISGFVQNDLHEDGLKLFVNMPRELVQPNNLTYLSSLMACSGVQALREGRQIHGLVWKLGLQSDLCIESALMDMYAKCRVVEDAWQIFDTTEEFDEVFVTVILVGLAQNGFEEEAIQMFVKVVRAGYEIDPNMASAALGLFGVSTSLGLGKQIHSLVIKRSFSSNPFVANGLINMYSKCGDLDQSTKVFSRMLWRNSVSWNSMIAAFARHGDGYRALLWYKEMRLEGVEPTDITFLSLLHACSHVGLVDMGMDFLKSMSEVHGICPRTEHYACIVDMLGRAGLLSEAKAFIEGLPLKPDVLVWQALIGACGIHGDTEMGKYAAERLIQSEPDKPAPYVLLANIYSSKGKWRERARTIKRMKEMGVARETGLSWIEIEKKVHRFVVQDRMHPQAEIIYGVLVELFGHMVDEGYVPDRRFILYYLGQDEKE